MFHDPSELQALARIHQQELLDAGSKIHRGRIEPSLVAHCRRRAGLALIAAGERLADRRTIHPAPRPAMGRG